MDANDCGHLNDYKYLDMDTINKTIATVTHTHVYDNRSTEFKTQDGKKFTMYIVGTNLALVAKDGDTRDYVVTTREYDDEARRFQHQYFMATCHGKDAPVQLTEKILLRPLVGMLIDEVMRLIGQHILIDTQIIFNERYRSEPANQNILYPGIFNDPNYNKELFQHMLDMYSEAIQKFRLLVYEAVSAYNK